MHPELTARFVELRTAELVAGAEAARRAATVQPTRRRMSLPRGRWLPALRGAVLVRS